MDLKGSYPDLIRHRRRMISVDDRPIYRLIFSVLYGQSFRIKRPLIPICTLLFVHDHTYPLPSPDRTAHR